MGDRGGNLSGYGFTFHEMPFNRPADGFDG